MKNEKLSHAWNVSGNAARSSDEKSHGLSKKRKEIANLMPSLQRRSRLWNKRSNNIRVKGDDVVGGNHCRSEIKVMPSKRCPIFLCILDRSPFIVLELL